MVLSRKPLNPAGALGDAPPAVPECAGALGGAPPAVPECTSTGALVPGCASTGAQVLQECACTELPVQSARCRERSAAEACPAKLSVHITHNCRFYAFRRSIYQPGQLGI